MRTVLILALSSLIACGPTAPAKPQPTGSAEDQQPSDPELPARVLVSGLEGPWEVTWGPDDMLWVTERAGRRVTRIDPESGTKRVAVTIGEVLVDMQHQGLLGMALHPELLAGSGNDYVYVAYTYDGTPGDGDEQDNPRAKVVRFTYQPDAETLSEPSELISGIPAGNDHNGGRLKIGPDGKLFYSLGEQGANQFANFCKPIEAQRLPTGSEVQNADGSAYKGKILRMELDGGIPVDNPMFNGVRSHIYTYGHRNPQGIVFGRDGTLYQAEHAANADDEMNIIRAGGNYGWPHVAGYRDNQAYAYVNWSAALNCQELTWTNLTDPASVPAGVPRAEETDYTEAFVEPIMTLYTVPNGYDFEDETCGETFFICRPSIAPSSVDYYPQDGAIPGWGGSLLVTSLKNGALYRFKLSGDGQGVRDTDQLFDTVNRYRDLAIGPDNRTFYIATDSAGFTRDANGGATDVLANPGSIMVFRFAKNSGTAP
ncbi:glucose/sorbosone family PQQ-dependent dehydrogenase [Hyalangium sp.]|uniref:glucose/sorbosone family PQQ-dependent dehydrogenase n=1 Tax=Hyalangium sp. TaxID=2028555 RepID=UPI002D73978D|nr:glucose/sorbosone family PQQ-dependent dehydrogenase [Hyalangium sp.]HYH94861.1 glucose/sorbosone family PQQ-dependent dehydrogenase [Hyalangium sp.]